VVAQSVNFMPKRSWSGQAGQAGASASNQSEPAPEPSVDEGEIPF
jgi:hypothetical protein